MRLKIVQNGTSLHEPVLFTINISGDKLEVWYQEMMKRFIEDYGEKYDIDEAYECGQMSIAHFNEMINFLFNKQ